MPKEYMQDQTFIVAGYVKWFNPKKSFGFVVPDDGGDDILLHSNVLKNFGQGSVAEGLPITLNAQTTERGLQAVEILKLGQPPQIAETTLSEYFEDLSKNTGDIPWEPARVRWFDEGKGFGFANVFGRSDDVFLHVEVLRRSGLADLQPGEALALRVIEGKRGQMAAEVLAWEAALANPED